MLQYDPSNGQMPLSHVIVMHILDYIDLTLKYSAGQATLLCRSLVFRLPIKPINLKEY